MTHPIRPALTVLAAFLVAFAGGAPVHGQADPDEPGFMGYDPSPTYPFGRPNPEAPPEIEQFHFMVGQFDCIDRIRQPDGTWREFPAVWNASYFLNGMGIQDQYWGDTFATSNIRIFDPERGVWLVTFFRMPGYQSGLWVGQQEGETMVMRPPEVTSGSGLTFYDITPDSYRWRSGDNPGWTSECVRRR